MAVPTQHAVRVFAVLEHFRDGSPDILDAILFFFLPILAEYAGQAITPAEIAHEVNAVYHWNITSDVVEELIPRFLSKGWVQSVAATSDSALFRIKDELPTVLSEQEGTDFDETLSAIGEQFQEFIGTLSPLTAFSRSRDELVDILLEWLISIEAYSEQILQSYVNGVTRTGDVLSISFEVEESSRLGSEEKYLCARFVKSLFDGHSPYTPILCRIASVGLLTEVVQDLRHPITAVNKTDLTIYLDAPVALDLLGVSGQAALDNIRPIIEQLQGIGATVRIFRASVNELKHALGAVLKRPPAERTGPTAHALRKNEVIEAFVREVARDPDSALAKLKILVVERTLDQFPGEHEFFTAENYEDFFGRLAWHLEIPRREHDATVVTLIMRMRRRYQSPDVFRSRHLLITRNPLLSQSARAFCIEHDLIRPDSIGPAIHQRQLATAAWLRTGLGAEQREAIPRRYLLAACERVLELRKTVIDQVRYVAKALTPEKRSNLTYFLRKIVALKCSWTKHSVCHMSSRPRI